MKAQAFDELLSSVREAGRIHRGKARPSRRTSFRVADVKAIRAGLGQTQEAFATMIGVSVATLRNWEQGRRTPEGPALALLRVAEAEPIAVARALIGESRRGSEGPGGGTCGQARHHDAADPALTERADIPAPWSATAVRRSPARPASVYLWEPFRRTPVRPLCSPPEHSGDANHRDMPGTDESGS